MASSEDSTLIEAPGNAETAICAQGRRTCDGTDTDVVGNDEPGVPARGVKDLRSITDPAAGSGGPAA